MADLPNLTNGTAYSWADGVFIVNGVPIAEVTAISWKASQEKQNNYGTGSDVISRSRGRKSYEGSITVVLSELYSIVQGSPNNNPLELLPFTVQATFVPEGGGVPVTVSMKNCEFTEYGFDISEGDMSIPVELPVLPGSIKII